MNDPLEGDALSKAMFIFASTFEEAFIDAALERRVSIAYCTVYSPMSVAALIAVDESEPAGNRTAKGYAPKIEFM